MATLTYCKGLLTPADELNELGFTDFEMFLEAYAPIFRAASIETVNHLLLNTEFNKSDWNTHLQQTYSINKRLENGVISAASCRVAGAKEHRFLHIKTLEIKIKSISAWLNKAAKRKLALASNFYVNKKWQNSNTGGNFSIDCWVQYKCTNWQSLRFKINHKKRIMTMLTNRIEHLRVKPIKVFVPHGDIFVVGSKDESFGNQVSSVEWEQNNFESSQMLRVGNYISSECFYTNTRYDEQFLKIHLLPESCLSRTPQYLWATALCSLLHTSNLSTFVGGGT